MLNAIEIRCYNCSIDVKATGMNIRMLRKARKITINDLAEVFCGDATVQAIYQWESGKTLPKIDKLFVLAKVFDVSMDDIIVGRVRINSPTKVA